MRNKSRATFYLLLVTLVLLVVVTVGNWNLYSRVESPLPCSA
jgi:hypothetical protein